jgi:competence ComEA-like helix-hairpin-helix protein
MHRRTIAFAAALCLMLALSAASFARPEHKKQPPPSPLDLNAATADQLEQLPGVGPKMAKAIVDFRQKSGPFRRVDELLAIKGITKERLDKIRPFVKIVAPDVKKQSHSG